jgi:hypothetical protein
MFMAKVSVKAVIVNLRLIKCVMLYLQTKKTKLRGL